MTYVTEISADKSDVMLMTHVAEIGAANPHQKTGIRKIRYHIASQTHQKLVPETGIGFLVSVFGADFQ